MNPDLSYVSIVEPIGPAIERVKTVLFRPFDLGKWCVIGFSAWLAQLGFGGGGGGGWERRGDVVNELYRVYYEAEGFVLDNLHWLIPVALAVLAVIIGLILLVTWLSSRARFSFLYCVAQNKGEFWYPWRQYRAHGNSLFAFRVVVGILAFVALVPFLVLTGVLIAISLGTFGFGLYTVSGIVMSILLFSASLIVFGAIRTFTTDFAVPIMYLRNITCRQAWGVLAGMVSANMGRFILYYLFRIVIIVAIIILVVGTTCVCCIACCFLAIPYVRTVVLLPVSVFVRSYSLYYLAQYGPDFNVFPTEPEPEAAPPTAELQI